jgi:hypothetical protein
VENFFLITWLLVSSLAMSGWLGIDGYWKCLESDRVSMPWKQKQGFEPGPNVIIFKTLSPKEIAKTMYADFCHKYYKFLQKLNHNIVF